MSEPLPGHGVGTVSRPPPRPSASVLISRDGPGGLVEVLLGLRNPLMRSFPNYWSFPGGGVSRSDLEVLDLVGIDRPDDVDDAASQVAVTRELAEEVGWLVTVEGVEAIEEELQDGLQEGPHVFAQAWRERRLAPAVTRMRLLDRRTTPPFGPVGFENRFHHLHIDGRAPRPRPASSGEFMDVRWFTPEEALARWWTHELRVPPPVVEMLRMFSDGLARTNGDAQRAAQHVAEAPTTEGARIWFAAGVEVVPIPTATLPPATHTNCYLLGEPGGERLLVDPAVQDDEGMARLEARMAAVEEDDGRVAAVLLTHHHSDHVGDHERVNARWGLPLWCSGRTGELIGRQPTRTLLDGDVVELAGPAGGQRWDVLITPGHADGHVCLHGQAGLVSGDMVAGVGTILVPRDGRMEVYIDQLERLAALQPTLIFPSHGPVIATPDRVLAHYMRHRTARHQAVLEAVRDGLGQLARISERAYADSPDAPKVLAEDQTHSHLLALERQGLVRMDNDGWTALVTA